ncbi:LexA family protein [Pantoea ananatis]|uniref:LexA family protein n=1 Tax=Pantoea ananas TaxID=553 RepID=UPI001B30E3FB|nr:S24 family peptidase [Pantoea ananatis]
MGTLGTRLKTLRKERKLTQAQLGKAIGVSDVTIGYWEKDQNQPGGVSLTKLAKFFGVSESFFVTGKEEGSNVSFSPMGYSKVPVISWVQAGNWTAANDASNVEGVLDFILTSEPHSVSTFALLIRGKSMEPDFKEGDSIIVDPELYPKPGDYVVAKNGSDEATFKKYRSRGVTEDGEDAFELVPLNEDFATLNSLHENIEIIGVVVEHRRKMR